MRSRDEVLQVWKYVFFWRLACKQASNTDDERIRIRRNLVRVAVASFCLCVSFLPSEMEMRNETVTQVTLVGTCPILKSLFFQFKNYRSFLESINGWQESLLFQVLRTQSRESFLHNWKVLSFHYIENNIWISRSTTTLMGVRATVLFIARTLIKEDAHLMSFQQGWSDSWHPVYGTLFLLWIFIAIMAELVFCRKVRSILLVDSVLRWGIGRSRCHM